MKTENGKKVLDEKKVLAQSEPATFIQHMHKKVYDYQCRKGNIFYGKSKVLNTPTGTIVKNLVLDGVRVGMSSRALGKIDQESESEVGHVTEMKLVAIDCVADPSYSDAFVNGILESKQWILNRKGEFEEHYNAFEESLKTLPTKDVNDYLTNKIIAFIKSIRGWLPDRPVA